MMVEVFGAGLALGAAIAVVLCRAGDHGEPLPDWNEWAAGQIPGPAIDPPQSRRSDATD